MAVEVGDDVPSVEVSVLAADENGNLGVHNSAFDEEKARQSRRTASSYARSVESPDHSVNPIRNRLQRTRTHLNHEGELIDSDRKTF